MGAASKRLAGSPQTERSPASGVRPRVLPPQVTTPDPLPIEPAPFSLIPPANRNDDGDLPLEDAVPFHGNTAIAAVFLFVTSAAAAMVAVGLYL